MDFTLTEISNANGLDFNTAVPQHVWTSPAHHPLQVDVLKQRLHNQLTSVLIHLFPLGKICHPHFVIGNVHGQQGESLKVELQGPRIGLWHDFTTGEGGDIITLWGAVHGWDCRHHFPEIIQSIQTWLGEAPVTANKAPQPSAPEQPPQASVSPFGNPTAQWDYEDAEGSLLARVYRYDTATGKQYRPWDAKSRCYKAPDPRPLYNQRGIAQADTVILVEGEKCAQALIDCGLCATTAMNGAKAPLAKTDWSPLKGKHVILWPDNDKVGHAYADSLIGHLQALGVASLARISIPDDKPKAWDAADAVEEGMDIQAFLQTQRQEIALVDTPDSQMLVVPAFTAGQLMEDTRPLPDDLIAPRILTPGGLLVFGGAPKVGKTDLMLSWLAHMAAGVPFLGMTPPRPLKIFYLQTEILYDYLRERLQSLTLDPALLPLVKSNLVITPQIRLLLDEDGVNKVYHTILKFFAAEEVDIVVIDPLRNIFDGGPSGSENDNSAMLSFLQNRIEELRLRLNPQAGIILTHHTKKMSKNLIEEDPFQAFSGAASLRSFYTTGMLLFRPDEQQGVRHLMFELRNGQSIPTKSVDKIEGQWQEISLNSERLVRQEYGEKLDAERRRRHDVILQLIFEGATKGTLYTPTQFCQAFEGQAGLGGRQTIHNRLDVLATKGYIKFNKEEDYRVERSKYGIMCVEGMAIPVAEQIETNSETGEVLPALKPLLPTHFKESQTGAILPVENPEVWVYLD